MTDDEIIEVVSAHKEGKKIERREIDGSVWLSLDWHVGWDFVTNEYRVVPEPREWWSARESRNHSSWAGDFGSIQEARAAMHRFPEFDELFHVREVLP